jgi:hypothetical protein
MPAISNTSPVILLAKIGRLKLIKNLYEGLVITPFVKRETVDKGKELGAIDAREIEGAIKAGWIKVSRLNKRQRQQAQRLVKEAKIGFGEAEALVKAADKELLLIVDDKEARAIAKSWGLEYTGTPLVLYEAFVKGLVSYDELIDDLAKLTKVMWISTEVITEIIRRAKGVRK